MQVERRILEMLLEGKIDIEEALHFLEDLKPKDSGKGFFGRKLPRPFKTVHIKVNDPSDGESIDVKIPLSILKTGIKIAEKEVEEFSELGIDHELLEEVAKAAKEGQDGLVVDVKSSEGLSIEIYIL